MRLLVVSLMIVLSACASKSGAAKKGKSAATNSAGELQLFADLEDRRSLGDGKLMQAAITSTDPAVRKRALLALGRIQDPHTAGAMIEGLSDPDASVRAEAAFAIGLLGLSWAPLNEEMKSRLGNALLEKEGPESDAATRVAMLEAMGRVATPQLVERLVDRLGGAPDVAGRAALSIGVAAKSKVPVTSRAFPALADLLKKESPATTRYGAAYALMQTKSDAARPLLLGCLTDENSEVRALCAKGLSDTGTDSDAVALRKLIDDPDYRVAVEAARSLARISTRCKSSACVAIGALTDLNLRAERLLRGDTAGGGQPLLALSQAELPPFAKALLSSLRSQLGAGKNNADARVKKDAANLDCRFAAAQDRLSGAMTETVNCGFGVIEEAHRLQLGLHALADSKTRPTDPRKALEQVGSYLLHPDARVKLAAVELLGTVNSQPSMEKLRPLLLSGDLVLATAAATSLSKLGDKTQVTLIRQLGQKVSAQADLAPAIAEALATLDGKEAVGDLEGWLQSPHAAVRQAAAEALSTLKGSAVTAERVEAPASATKFQAPPANAHLIVVTEKGEFEVALYVNEAPRTSGNAFELAKKGFFKNLTFHRVVPDFVVQGGDPRADGNGGPGYTIRCEVNHKPYARNVVGMALSGKDTGGSQFFVTTAAQPHLDGRYTTFGEVIRGQEVVDALLEGDRILEVRATPAPRG
ncbi:MAG: peptidyl-prolyl cis-trans isomerase [Archangium gephyra]|uniref:peptidylprolyl isomerase n=1 Tax=Archangium gephyra TaxID=48 RepID=A0A2W5TWJ2_9BACT|nr:MAG: peptidyl-prolyl cis-trans isomerase [Archangium gephyra]